LKVRFKLKELLETRGISIRQLANDTGYPFESLRRIYNNDTERFPKEILASLCEYLGVGISDIIVLEDDDRQE